MAPLLSLSLQQPYSSNIGSNRYEEEQLPLYREEDFYPVQMGETFHLRYQVVAKLGFGTGSTVWLARDLRLGEYCALKVGTIFNNSQAYNEIAVANLFKSFGGAMEHPGMQNIRLAVDHFELTSASGLTHTCLVYPPMGMTFTEFRNRFPGHVFPKLLFRRTTRLIGLGLDLLHQAGVVHTDISPNNILLGVPDQSVFEGLETQARELPAEKLNPGHTIYGSQKMPVTDGQPVICDFGEARTGKPGQKYVGDAMPESYRAPEIILGMEWDARVDVWSLGCMMFDIFEGGRLFYGLKNQLLDDEQHLAEMVSLMGPPPKRFLERSGQCQKYWDAEGNWIAETPVPEQSWAVRETRLGGREQELFIDLLRRIFCWLPEERATARDVAEDPFFQGSDRDMASM